MSNIEALGACFREVLALPPDFPINTLVYQGHPSWDSVAHMRLVAAIETTFDIMMETDQILDMSSFDKAIEILKANDVELSA